MKKSVNFLTILIIILLAVIFPAGWKDEPALCQRAYASETGGEEEEDSGEAEGEGPEEGTGESQDGQENEPELEGTESAGEVNEAAMTQDELTDYRKAMNASTDNISEWPVCPPIGSESAVLLDSDTGVILYEKNADVPRYPASTTKVMTCLLAAEKCSMDEVVTFSKEAVFGIERGSSNVGMDVGESITMEEAIYCVMMHSANEVASAIAEHVSGSVEEFCNLMNERAAQLGCTNTHFTNANGLPDENHLTTARDLALITQAYNQNPTLVRIASTKNYTMEATPTQPDTFLMTNHHKMHKGLKYEYEYFVWGKTGYTNVARSTLVSVARCGGMDLVCVVMKAESPSHYTDTQTLFDYGFNNFHKMNIAENESRYIFEDQDFFDTNVDIFGDSSALLRLNEGGNCIVPSTASFEDLEPVVTYDDTDSDSEIALITYYYNGWRVGATTVDLVESEANEFEFGDDYIESSDGEGGENRGKADSPLKGFGKGSLKEGESGGSEDEGQNQLPINTGNRIIYVPIKYVAAAAAGLVVIVIIVFVVISLISRGGFTGNSQKRRMSRRSSKRYFSEFDDFDF